ncbi:MAG TPA: isochorismatase family protein [Planctomycetota bacterium]|nr:isochorismatase family protein [Planctomycetota bacterium]
MHRPFAWIAVAALGAAVSGVQEPRAESSPADARPAPGAPPRVRADDLAVLVVDVQPQFVDAMAGPAAPVLERIEQLLLRADLRGVPVVATVERVRRGEPRSVDRVVAALPEGSPVFVKSTFDATREPEIAAALRALGRRQIAVVGCETDVCVLQTVLGLLDLGFETFLVEDAIFSLEGNVGPALRRMQAAGAVPTTFKTLHFEMEERVGAGPGDAARRARFERLRQRLRDPYDLTPSAPSAR